MHFGISKQTCFIVVLFSVLFLGPRYGFAITLFDVEIDTSFLSGTSAQLAFDLVDGDGIVNNTATISNFSTNGSLGTASSSGGPVTGSLSGTAVIGDTGFFNELLQNITLGSSIKFTLGLTENNPGAFIPDQFSFFLLDSFSFPLFTTTDPFFADALFAVDITGASGGNLANFTATSGSSPTWTVASAAPVPEPATFLLFGTGLFLFVSYRQLRR